MYEPAQNCIANEKASPSTDFYYFSASRSLFLSRNSFLASRMNGTVENGKLSQGWLEKLSPGLWAFGKVFRAVLKHVQRAAAREMFQSLRSLIKNFSGDSQLFKLKNKSLGVR